MTYPLNSLSGDQCLQVQLNLQEVALDQTHYCFYNRLPPSVGDGDRCFYQGDGGSENGMFGNYNEGIYRLWAAALRPGDRHYARHHKAFATEQQAKDWVDHLGRILVHDTLPAPLHNGMITGKCIGVAHSAVASFGSCRLLAQLPTLHWEREVNERGVHAASAISVCSEYGRGPFIYVVHVRRMHTQGRLAGWQASLLQVAPAGTNGAAR